MIDVRNSSNLPDRKIDILIWSNINALAIVTKHVQSDMRVFHRTKGTLGITGLSPFRVPIDGGVRHLDVGLSHPGAERGSKGSAVRRLKRYMSWV